MCGIAGFLKPGPSDAREMGLHVQRMADQLVHRGPDDSGVWVDGAGGIALGFRRLAILDLSPTGHQPMLSSGGRYAMVFNGEVYNFKSLRKELEGKGHTFRGSSDTEVMLASIEEWGLEAAVKKFTGMFAFALWDRRERRLHLVRDRLGIKPLYYGGSGGWLLFGSELKAIRAHPQFQARISRNALALQMRYNDVPQPHSIYEGVYKLTQGCILTLRCGDSPPWPQPSAYWSAQKVWARGAANPFRGSGQDAAQEMDSLLRDSVRHRMIADVPLGAFLSGGVDSSTVVALMQAQSARPVKTFTIGFDDARYNEAPYAQAVAAHLETEHTELTVTPAEAMAVIPRLPAMFDEPFSDSSQIPTYLVSALARKHVTVSLSGDGGDELFGGYPRYRMASGIWKRIRWLPAPIRRMLSRAMSAPSPEVYNRWLDWTAAWFHSYGRAAPMGEKAGKLAASLAAANFRELYRLFISHSKDPASLVLGASETADPLTSPDESRLPDLLQRMALWDLATYLPDDILTKVDRASMAVSLEARVPILDHHLVEFAARLPPAMKIRGGQGKWLLRQVLSRYVPEKLIARPKMGFSAPVGDWLRGALRDWAEALLDEARLRREGYFQPQPLRKLWLEHLSGQRDGQDLLWDVLMFQAWREQWE